MRTEIGLDDWLVMVSMLLAIVNCACNEAGLVPNGLGKSEWSLTPDMMTKVQIYLYITAALYAFNVAMTKLAMLAFFQRLFPSVGAQRALLGTFIFVILWGFAYGFFTLFQCSPISYFWKGWDGEHSGKCAGSIRMILSHAGLNITIDVWMLFIPISQLIRLGMDWKKKAGVFLMFLIGTL